MKIDIGPYKNWVGPYQIAEKILFWIPKYDEKNCFEYTKAYDKYVHPFGEWLAEDKNGNDSWLTKFCQWIESKRKRKMKIRIDHYDTWSMDSTLATIILPMLKQLKATKHGSGYVELEDVPPESPIIPKRKIMMHNKYLISTMMIHPNRNFIVMFILVMSGCLMN
jgi:hypothetical protein